MLQVLRDRASGLLVKTILWSLVAAFVGTIFLVWGYGSDKREEPVAKVAGSPITQAEYRRYYDSMLQNLRQMLGGQQFSSDMIKQFNIEKSALDSVIMERLVYLAAQDAGIVVSDDEMRFALENNKDFQRDGKFDKEIFTAILKANKVSPREFEKLMRRELLSKKMTGMISASVPVTEQEIKDAYVAKNETLSFKYVSLPRESAESKVKFEDKDLEAYMKTAPAEKYMLPEQRRVERVTAHPEDFVADQKVADNVAETYYNGHKDQFILKTQEVRARHILIETPKKPTPKSTAEAAKLALSILDKLKKGADFAEMAKKYSNDPGSAKLGGDLGFFQPGRMVPEFDKAAFELPVGKLSDVVKTSFGWHIIKVEEKHPAGQMPYKDVAKQIKDAMALAMAKAEAENRLTRVIMEKSGKPLAEIAKSLGLKSGSYTVDAGEQTKKLQGSEPLVKRIFELKKGETAGPIEAAGDLHMIRLLDIIPPHQAKLSEVREDVAKEYKHREALKLVEETADKIVKEAKAGTDIAKVAKTYGAQLKDSEFVKRNDSKVGDVAAAGKLIEAAFPLKQGEFQKVQAGDEWYVITITQRKQAEMGDLEKDRQKLKEELLRDKGKAAVREWQTALRKDAEKRGILKIEKKVDLTS